MTTNLLFKSSLKRLLSYSLLFFSIFLFNESNAKAYPQDQFNECILAAKSNPAVLGAPEKAIQNFCDCSLKAILDEGRNDVASANQCARASFTR